MEHHNKKRKNTYWYAAVVGLCFVAFFTFVSVKFLSQARLANDELIAEHIVQLDDIFKRINETCTIIGFRHKKDYIDFLNVKSFAGSVVGSMNLAEPAKWQGPYVHESLTIGGKEYQIVATKKGFYIVPGDGVRLANGKILGKTLHINYRTDIEALMRDPKALLSDDKPLAAHIETYQNPFEALSKTDFLDEEIETTY